MLEVVWSTILRCLPRIHIVDPDESGVLIRLGKIKKATPPGWYFCWPFVDWVETINIKPQIIKTDIQSMTTSDGRAVAVRAAIEYWIPDAEKAQFEVQDADESLIGLAAAIIAKHINTNTFAECSKLESFGVEIVPEIRKTSNDWGLRIKKFWITDLVEHKVYRVIGSNAPESIISEED